MYVNIYSIPTNGIFSSDVSMEVKSPKVGHVLSEESVEEQKQNDCDKVALSLFCASFTRWNK